MNIILRFTVIAALVLGLPIQARAQRMFLDTNNDGLPTTADRLVPGVTTTVTLWVQTDATTDPNSAASRGTAGELLTINSYEFVLHASGGAVKWGRFTNLQESMSGRIGPYSNESDFYVGQFGMEKLPAGRHKLGTLEVTPLTGNPVLSFGESSPVWQCAQTSFGSLFDGRDGDNTLKYARPASRGSLVTSSGDWGDAVGLGEEDAKKKAAAINDAEENLRFAATVVNNALASGPSLIVTTTRPGSLRVRLFDASGRLARTIVDESVTARGRHVFNLGATARTGKPLASGIYYFRVESPEGQRSGKIAIVR